MPFEPIRIINHHLKKIKKKIKKKKRHKNVHDLSLSYPHPPAQTTFHITLLVATAQPPTHLLQWTLSNKNILLGRDYYTNGKQEEIFPFGANSLSDTTYTETPIGNLHSMAT